MAKINVNRRGETGSAGIVTLSHLRAGETFRFPRSAAGTVYQLLALSERGWEAGLRIRGSEFMFVNVATGQIYATDDVRTVVPVSCSLTVRERTNNKPAKRRNRRSARRRTR